MTHKEFAEMLVDSLRDDELERLAIEAIETRLLIQMAHDPHHGLSLSNFNHWFCGLSCRYLTKMELDAFQTLN